MNHYPLLASEVLGIFIVPFPYDRVVLWVKLAVQVHGKKRARHDSFPSVGFPNSKDNIQEKNR